MFDNHLPSLLLRAKDWKERWTEEQKSEFLVEKKRRGRQRERVQNEDMEAIKTKAKEEQCSARLQR